MDIVIATLIVVAVMASALAQDFSILSWAYWQEGGSGASRSEVFRNFGLFLAAGIALVFAFWRAKIATDQAEAAAKRADATIDQARAANEQARIAEQGQFTERFSRAAEHLGSGQLPVRLGGIYALWRLTRDSPERDVISVIDILCAFVRDPLHPDPLRETPDPDPDPDGSVADAMVELLAETPPGPDVQAILNLIGAREAPYRAHLPDGYRLDLSGANLSGATLNAADLSGAILSGAALRAAKLWAAKLRGANLMGADLTGADLTDADLKLTNVTQDQLDSACIQRHGRPPTLLSPLKPPQKVYEAWRP